MKPEKMVAMHPCAGRDRDTDMENDLGHTSGEGEKQKCMLGVQSKRHKVLCIKQISSKDILFSIEKYSHYLFIMFWSIICKVTESLCCSSETNIML